MTEIGAGQIIYDLRKKIQQVKADLKELGEPISDIPEMIESANLMRSNEYLSKANEKKTQLLAAYELYCKSLEDMLATIFDIQKDLRDVIRDQSALISRSKKRVKPKVTSKSKAKSKPKTRKR